MRKPIWDRFWSKVAILGDDECWPWQASSRKSTEGYGAFYLNGQHRPASRVAWVLMWGLLPKEMHVLHECDNPKCCNPAHLFVGTNMDNVADKCNKKRHAYGERNGFSKLNDESASQILALKPTSRSKHGAGYAKQIAQHFGVSAAAIYDIWTRRWRHLEGVKNA